MHARVGDMKIQYHGGYTRRGNSCMELDLPWGIKDVMEIEIPRGISR